MFNFINQAYFLLIIIGLINIVFFINLQKLSYLLNFYDYPQKKRKIHKSKTSLLGGSVFFICLNVYFIFDYYYFERFINISYISLILSLSLIFIVGIVDDKKDIKAFIKSVCFIFIILLSILPNEILIIQNLKFSFIENKINLNNFSIVFTIFCIFLINKQ